MLQNLDVINIKYGKSLVAYHILFHFQYPLLIDYNGYNFEIEIGDVLAFFGEFNFNADINYEKLRDYGGLFTCQ